MALSTKLLAPQIEAVAAWLLGKVPRRNKTPLNYYYEFLYNPIVSAGLELRILYGLAMLGDYTHPNHEIQEEIRAGLNGLNGSWLHKVGQMMPLPFGYSFTEKAFKIRKRKATLSNLITVDPRRYDFEGSQDRLTHLEYTGVDRTFEIPYENGIHLVHQPYLTLGNDPYGWGILERIEPYYELLKIVLAAMAIASQRQATPLLIGKTDTTADTLLLGENGQPYRDPTTNEYITLKQAQVMLSQLEQAENSSVLVIDRLDEITAIAQQTDGNFFKMLLSWLEGQIYLCCLIPRTITGTSETGTGDSNLNSGHREALRLTTRGMMLTIAESLVEELIKDWIIFNHGEQDDYGEFPIKDDNPLAIELLDALSNAVQRGALDPKDLEVANKARELIGVAPLTKMPDREEPKATGDDAIADSEESDDTEEDAIENPPTSEDEGDTEQENS